MCVCVCVRGRISSLTAAHLNHVIVLFHYLFFKGTTFRLYNKIWVFHQFLVLLLSL